MGVRSYQLPVTSCQLKRSLLFLAVSVTLFAAACSGIKDGTISRIALLAPFEGRYREVGYDAYYAVKLALQDAGNNTIELLAVGDGETAESATDRARALALDPLVKVVIVLGYPATQPEAQQALSNKPTLIVGQWGARPETEAVFMLANATVDERFGGETIQDVTDIDAITIPILGNEVLALHQIPLLTSDTDLITVVSSASLPDPDFTERYRGSAEFVPEPGLLTTLTYDATQIALEAIKREGDVQETIAAIYYDGINGRIRFESGYWADAPIHCYGYVEEQLTPKDCPVE